MFFLEEITSSCSVCLCDVCLLEFHIEDTCIWKHASYFSNFDCSLCEFMCFASIITVKLTVASY